MNNYQSLVICIVVLSMTFGITQAQVLAIQKLEITKSSTLGLTTFVRASDAGPIAIQKPAGRPVQPMDFFLTQGQLFGIMDPVNQLKFDKVDVDRLRQVHTTFQQRHKGVSVFSGVMKVHQDHTGAVVAANGHFYPISNKLNVTPTMTLVDAVTTAKLILDQKNLQVEHSELVIVDPGWYGDRPVGPHLAYYIILRDFSVPVREAFFIDAHTGKSLDQWNLLHTGLNREIWNDATGMWARFEGDPPFGDIQVDNPYDYAGDWYDYFSRGFGRDSYDDIGGTMGTTVNLIDPRCPNAFGGGGWTWFCPNIVCDDVVGHEWGHSLTGFTAGLIYQNQSGQLNESYSDVWGEMVDLFNGNAAFHGTPGGTAWPIPGNYVSGNGTDTPNNLRTGCNSGVRWMVFEDCSAWGGAIRDMWEPTCFGDPDRANHEFQTCAGGDNGGVHTGSGVPNHAFAMLTDGKTFNGYRINPIGPIKAAAVWYRALTVYLTPTSNFEDAYYALNQAAADLVSNTIIDPRDGTVFDTFTADDAVEVDRALLATEMNTEGLCGWSVDVLDTAPPVECATRSVFYSDDFESGEGDWTYITTGAPTTPYTWIQVGGLPHGRPGTAWFIEDRDIGDCGAQDEAALHTLFSPMITLPAILQSPTLSFSHYVVTEGGWDGGNIKISVNGGSYIQIPSSAFLHNPYNSSLIVDTPNPLSGQKAWTGTPIIFDGWGTSLIDLSSFVSGGEDIQFRFDFGKDGCVGIWGWFLDDFELYTCPCTLIDRVLPDPVSPGTPACVGGDNYGLACMTCNGGDRNGELCMENGDCTGGICEPNHTLCPGSTCGGVIAGLGVNSISWPKSRYIGVKPNPTSAGIESAIRVRMIDVNGFAACNGEIRWAGAPAEYNDDTAGTVKFWGSQLQATPHWMDWSTVDVVQLFGDEVIPDSRYAIQMVSRQCEPTINLESSFSTPSLMVDMAKWADVVQPLYPFTAASQPAISDVLKIVDKWLGAMEPAKSRAQLQPQVIDPSQDVNIADILKCVDAWLGTPYPFSITTCP